MSWSAKQYSAFEAERTRPVCDLVTAITTVEAQWAVDLGCGPGNSTAVLAQRYPVASVLGIDSSADMLHAARTRLPAVTFTNADIERWQPTRQYDVILANASLQWLPDHAVLYPRLLSYVAPGGSLAIQTPDNLDEPVHRLAQEVANNGPWQKKIGAVRHPTRHAAAWYYALLSPRAVHVDIWRTTYLHPLENVDAVVEWFKGSALRPYLVPLNEEERSAYLAQYKAALTHAYPVMDDGKVLLPFPRLFMVLTM